MEALEVRCSTLEQQLAHVLRYLGTSEGTLVASYNQVAALEQRVQQQQAKIDALEQTQTLFQQSLETYLDAQFEQAQGQRGSCGQDFSNTVKFLSGQLASTVSNLQAYCIKTVQESLPLQKLQELEKRLSKPYSATTPLTPEHLQTQLTTLQLQLQNQPQQPQQPQQSPNQQPQELETIKQHIHHLETNLLEEVQRAYRTVYKPGDYGAPLAKLQTTVQMLNQEFQSFRGIDMKQFAETMIKTAHENLRAEFQTVLETRASRTQLEQFESTVKRVESFSKDVQTGFYAMKQYFETFEQEFRKKFSDEKWKTFEIKTIDSIHAKLEEEQIRFTTSLQSSVSHTHAAMRSEIQTLRQNFLEVSSEVKSELRASELQKRYAIFETRLSEQHSAYSQLESYYTKLTAELQKKLDSYDATIQSSIASTHHTTQEYLADQQTKYSALEAQYRTFERKQTASVTKLNATIHTLEESIRIHLHQIQDTNALAQTNVELQSKYNTMTSSIQSAFINLESSLPTKLEKVQEFIQSTLQTNIQEAESNIQMYMRTQTRKLDTFEEKYMKKTTKVVQDIQGAFNELEASMPTKLETLIERQIQRASSKLDGLLKRTEVSIGSIESKYADSWTTASNMLTQLEGVIKQKINTLHFRIDSLANTKGSYSSSQIAIQEYTAHTKCFYTALFGSPGQTTDTLGSFERIPGWDYICFTNQTIDYATGWTIINVDYKGTTPALEAKKYKWLSHMYLGEYDFVVWMDAYMAPNPKRQSLLQTWILSMKEKGLKLLHKPHPERTCIWDECDAVVGSKRDTEAHVNQVRSLLEKDAMPRKWGLFDTNILVKWNKDLYTQTISERIFKQLSTTSIRDQLAVTRIYYTQNYNQFYVQQLDSVFERLGTHVQIPIDSIKI